MSVRWISAVWADSPYRGERLLIHLALADYANDEGMCFPSQRTLARKARCSENYVRLTIKQMIADKLIEVSRDGGGRGITAVYQLLPPTTNGDSPKRKTPILKRATLLMNRNEPSRTSIPQSANVLPHHSAERIALSTAAAFALTKRTEQELRDALCAYPNHLIEKAVESYREAMKR